MDKPTRERIKEELRELDRRMMQLSVTERTDTEFEVLEVKYNRLRKLLYPGHSGGM